MGRMGRIGWVAVALAAGVALPTTAAFAVMGKDAILDRLQPKNKNMITMDEMRDAAGRTYDKIAKAHSGKVTLLQLGGRVTPADVKAAKMGEGAFDEPISRADYLALTSRFFSEANTSRKPDVSPADGTLSSGELTTPAGVKLMGLIE